MYVSPEAQPMGEVVSGSCLAVSVQVLPTARPVTVTVYFCRFVAAAFVVAPGLTTAAAWRAGAGSASLQVPAQIT